MSIRRVIFVSDPLCSWCWGMADAVGTVRQRLAARIDFDLVVGGINTTATTPLVPALHARLVAGWQRVAAITGQRFSLRLPADATFVYNSLPACRAVVTARLLTGAPPFAYLHALQSAFFLDAQSVTRLDVQVALAVALGLDGPRFAQIYALESTAEALRHEIGAARGYGTNAVPAVLIETERGRRLCAGGFVDADMLTQLLEDWLAREPPVVNCHLSSN